MCLLVLCSLASIFVMMLQSQSDTEWSSLHFQCQRKMKIWTSQQCTIPFRLKIMWWLSSWMTSQNISSSLHNGRWVYSRRWWVCVLWYLPCDTAWVYGAMQHSRMSCCFGVGFLLQEALCSGKETTSLQVILLWDAYAKDMEILIFKAF